MINILDTNYEGFQDFFNKNTDPTLDTNETLQAMAIFLTFGLAEVRDELRELNKRLDRVTYDGSVDAQDHIRTRGD